MELPRCFDYCDWSRSYLLPGGVATNIPRRGPGPGAHDHARGLLVELVLRLGATPVSLHYSETAQPRWAYDYSRTAVTAVLDAPGHGPVRVTTFARYWRVATVPETWEIFLNGRHLADEDRRHPPSQRYTAFIVARALSETTTPRTAEATGAQRRELCGI